MGSQPSDPGVPGSSVQVPPDPLPPGQLPPDQLPPGQLPPGQLPPGQLPPGSVLTPPGAASGAPPSSGAETNPANAPPFAAQPGQRPDGCQTPQPGPAPLRRLTSSEYSRTLEALLGDTSKPGARLPPELLGNGFGNDADLQPSSELLIERYSLLAADAAARVTREPEQLTRYAPCVMEVAAAEPGPNPAGGEATCTETFVRAFASAAYRRPVADAEVQELLELQQGVRTDNTWMESLGAVVEAALQAPDFLYRVEFGVAVPGQSHRQLTPHEMATRLSFLLWGSPPDASLQAAAEAGGLADAAGVRAEAERMLNDPRTKEVTRHFFSRYLPIHNLTDLARDQELFPGFSSRIGALMKEESHRFLEHTIFEGPGDWKSVLTSPYTFLNEELAEFYGIEGVTGEEFRQVELDPAQRLGLLTHGSFLAGTTVSNVTNPVRRGGYLLSHILCVEVPLPAESLAAEITPPPPSSGSTGRERYTAHSENEECAACHALLDPPGFALENYDAVGLWRDQENGVDIDASGNLSLLPQPFDGPVELVQQIAASEQTYDCFAKNWQNYAYGRQIESADSCNQAQLSQAFKTAGYDIQALLLAITQTDAFLYLPPEEL